MTRVVKWRRMLVITAVAAAAAIVTARWFAGDHSVNPAASHCIEEFKHWVATTKNADRMFFCQ